MAATPELIAGIAADLERSLERSKHAIPVGISSRHFHITKEHWRTLFGVMGDPTLHRQLLQPGFWAAKETVDIEGPKGKIARVRLVGPYRPKTQVEVSRTDAARLGVDAPVRGSGSLSGAAPIRIIGPQGSVNVKDALIISQRHLHLAPADSRRIGVADGEITRVRAGIGGPRELVFESVLARVSDKFALEFHIDTDEANAAWLKTGDCVHLV